MDAKDGNRADRRLRLIVMGGDVARDDGSRYVGITSTIYFGVAWVYSCNGRYRGQYSVEHKRLSCG